MRRKPFGKRGVGAMVTVFIFAVVFFLSYSTIAHAQTPPKKTKILLITQRLDHFINPEKRPEPGREVHMYEDGCKILAKCLEQTPNVETVICDKWPKDPAIKKDIGAIVLFTDPGYMVLFTEENEKEVADLLKKGVGLTAIHWATGQKATDEAWRRNTIPWLKALGGMDGIAGNNMSTAKVEKVIPDHPISRGVPEFDLEEEYYMNPALLAWAKPLFKARLTIDGRALDNPVAWVYDRYSDERFLGGRSYGVTLGHYHMNWRLEALRRLVVNGILWTAHLEIPKNGAPCAVSEQDLKLPNYWK